MSITPTAEDALQLSAVLDQVSAGDFGLADVLRLAPEQIEPLVDKALVHAQAGQPEIAEALLEKLCLVDTRSAMLPYLLAAVRAEQSKPAATIEAAQEALRRDPGSEDTAPFRGEVLLLLGKARLQAGADDEARPDLEAAAAITGPAQRVAQAILQGLG